MSTPPRKRARSPSFDHSKRRRNDSRRASRSRSRSRERRDYSRRASHKDYDREYQHTKPAENSRTGSRGEDRGRNYRDDHDYSKSSRPRADEKERYKDDRDRPRDDRNSRQRDMERHTSRNERNASRHDDRRYMEHERKAGTDVRNSRPDSSSKANRPPSGRGYHDEDIDRLFQEAHQKGNSEGTSGRNKTDIGDESIERILVEDDDQGLGVQEDTEAVMMAMMGFGGFDSTKGKKVEGTDVSATDAKKKRAFRQYMNRKRPTVDGVEVPSNKPPVRH